MAMILLFAREKPATVVPNALSESMLAALGLSCTPWAEGKKTSAFPEAQGDIQTGSIYVELPDLDEDEGQPVVEFEIAPRLDRDETIQGIVDEIMEQDKSLAEEINANTCDILLTFDDSPAAVEAASAIAYVLGTDYPGGILIPGFEDDDETMWFPDAEEFADYVFGDDLDEDDEDGDDEGDDEDDDK